MADPIANNVTEPEVVKIITKELEKLGDNVKANYDELNRRHTELKGLLNASEGKMNSLVEEQLKKLANDITVRQESLDKNIIDNTEKQNKLVKEFTSRIDELEIAFKRSPRGSMEDGNPLEKEAREFFITAMAGSSDGKGASFEKMKKMSVDIEAYKKYKDAFETFLRKKGGENALQPEEFKSLSVGVDPDGGYTVTPAMSNKIITKMFETDPMRSLASIETISTQALEWLVDWDEAGWGWEEETVAGAETDTPQFNKKRIPAHVIYAKPRASQTLLEDSGINISDWLAKKIADRFNRGMSAAFITGNGVGKPRGITTYSNGTTYGTIEQVASGAAAALTADGLINTKFTLIEQYLERATWLMSRSSVAASLLLKDGTGNYIWSPGLRENNYSMMLGLPVRMSTTMPAIAANALSVAIADFKEAYTIVDRLGITIQRDPFTVKPMVEFYTRARVGGDVCNFQAIKIMKIATSV